MKVRAVFEFQWVLFILSAMEFNQKMWAFSSPCSFYLPTAFFEKKKTKCFRSTAEGKRAFEKSYFFRVNFVTGAVNCEIVSILCVFVTPDSGNIFVERFNYWKIRLKSTSTSASKVCFCRWNGSFGRNREKCLEKCDSAGTQNNDVCRIGEWIFDQRICRLSRLQEHIQTFFDEAETYEESEGQNGKSADAGGPVIRNHCRAHRCTWSRSENPDQLGSELMREKLKLRIRSMSTCGEGKRGKQKCTAGLAASRYIGQISGRFFFNLQ